MLNNLKLKKMKIISKTLKMLPIFLLVIGLTSCSDDDDNNGNVEQATYNLGKLNGVSQWFSENGILLKSSFYKDDELNGQTIHYDALGHKLSEGNYVSNQKKGIWKYYKDEKLTKEIDHTNQKVISKKQ